MFDMKQNLRKKRWSRHLFWVLSLTLIISMIPVTPAMAADTSTSGNTTAMTQSSGSETSDSSDSSAAPSDTEKDSTSASSAPDTNKTPAAVPRRAPAAATVTVTYNANKGKFTSGYKNTVSATAGSTITLPTAENVSRSGARLAGWSTDPWAATPTYEPGAKYTVPSSDVKLHAVWQKTFTLAPNLNHMSGYYMVVDPAGTVQSEGKLEGPTQVTVTVSANAEEYFVNVFVKPEENYLITRLDTANVNNFIYPLGANYLGRPGSYLKEEDVKRMLDEGYVATFGWGSGYNEDGAKLYVNSQAFQPVPEAKITPDKTRNLNEGDVITMTVTLRAGDILNQYSAALSGTPVVHIGTGSGDSVVDLPLSNVTSSGNDTYTGTVQYTLTAEDIARDKLSAQVEATFNYSYKFPYKGEKGASFTLDTMATIDSQSETVTIDGYSTPHKVSYSYTYIGGVTPPDTIPACPADSATYSKGNKVNIAESPAKGITVRDDANGGEWKFLGWFLYDKETSGTVTMGDDNLTLEGRWQFVADPDSLTYDANTNGEAYEGETEPSKGFVGNLVVVAKNAFNRIGYRFLHWNTQADGKGTRYLADVDRYKLTPGTDILYAQWEKARHVTYALFYKGADGIDTSAYPAAITAVPQDAKDYYTNDSVTVSTDPAQRTVDDPDNHGTWTFEGWMNGTLAAGEKLTIGTDNIQLTGTWTFTPYDKLTYDGNGADSGSVATAEAASGTDVTVVENGFTRSGYRFTGWNTAKDGSGDAYKAGDSYTLKDGTDDVLYAQWEKARSVSYKLTYSGADKLDADKYPAAVKKVPEDTKEYYKGDTVTVSTDPAQRTVDDPDNHGTWTFGGWQTGGKDAGKTVTVDAKDITLTGTWTFTPYDKLTYDGNGADSGKVDGAEAASGKDVTVEKNGFSRDGYRFTGWNTAKDGSGDAYKAGDSYTLKAGTDDVLYAQWEKALSVSYKLTYSGADKLDADKYPAAVKKAPEDTKEYYKGDTVTVSTDPADRTIDNPDNHGTWTFEGWMNGTLAAGEKLTIGTDNIQLTGTWTFTPYDKLTYDGNGADSGKVDGAEAPSGKDVTVEKNGFSRSGYRFTGWNTAKDGSGDAYKAGDSYTLKDGTDDVLYAQWEKAETHKTHKKGGADRHSSGGNPDTGDVTGLYGYVLLLVTCAAAGIVLLLIRRRRNADRTK
ncbi:SHIRT domain-containing protein [Hornefia butyriciproducens]|uniref:SHIRT domain-containing protein n=1 Tax=Hornefia butyriciproducens TaxID=2652293 RepID=UPI002A91D8DC|nr:InlB B-repeat-containing protein [Hornefia butyriciproducens]MDY5422670.1 InlB B-repeat-containing protein [Hornefia butyriciproducens]